MTDTLTSPTRLLCKQQVYALHTSQVATPLFPRQGHSPQSSVHPSHHIPISRCTTPKLQSSPLVGHRRNPPTPSNSSRLAPATARAASLPPRIRHSHIHTVWQTYTHSSAPAAPSDRPSESHPAWDSSRLLCDLLTSPHTYTPLVCGVHYQFYASRRHTAATARHVSTTNPHMSVWRWTCRCTRRGDDCRSALRLLTSAPCAAILRKRPNVGPTREAWGGRCAATRCTTSTA